MQPFFLYLHWVHPSICASLLHDKGALQKIIHTYSTLTEKHTHIHRSTPCTITELQHLGNETWQRKHGSTVESCFLLTGWHTHTRSSLQWSISHACDVRDTGSITWPVITLTAEGLSDTAWLPCWETLKSTPFKYSRLWFVWQVTITHDCDVCMFVFVLFCAYVISAITDLDLRVRIDLPSTAVNWTSSSTPLTLK